MKSKPHQKLIKMQGTGNDFLLADFRVPGGELENLLASHSRSQWARHFCLRHFGVGADGFVFLDPPDNPQKFDFQWDFYNSDGSSAEMCGNAARCVTYWVSRQNPKKSQWRFKTAAGPVQSWMKGNAPCVEMTPVTLMDQKFQEKFHNQTLELQLLNSGVPHAIGVLNWKNHTSELKDWCHHLFAQKIFGPEGANITFLHPINQNTVEAITFERGVENFTLSCGTGATAAAWWAHESLQYPHQIQVQVPGGPLSIEITQQKTVLCGPAVLVAEIWPEIDAIEVKEN